MDLPKDFKDILNAVTNKRARFVIDTILDKGYCSRIIGFLMKSAEIQPICWTQIILCFYHLQQIGINPGHVNTVPIGLKKIEKCVKPAIMPIRKIISILLEKQRKN